MPAEGGSRRKKKRRREKEDWEKRRERTWKGREQERGAGGGSRRGPDQGDEAALDLVACRRHLDALLAQLREHPRHVLEHFAVAQPRLRHTNRPVNPGLFASLRTEERSFCLLPDVAVDVLDVAALFLLKPFALLLLYLLPMAEEVVETGAHVAPFVDQTLDHFHPPLASTLIRMPEHHCLKSSEQRGARSEKRKFSHR
eukprot:105369-Rhodomonas_salina.2